MTVKLLFFSGSARKDSVNKKLAKLAAKIAADQGVSVTYIDLADYAMPLYDGDLESERGVPEKAKALKELFISHNGFFIASPEYNSSFSPLLKNVLDWVSRAETEDEVPLNAYRGKVAALAAASPGGLGGLRGLVPLRMLLGNIDVIVVPQQLAVSGAMTAFDENGDLADEKQREALGRVVTSLIDTAGALKG